MSYQNLPAEVVAEILRKLPVKSVAKFRLVCKTWNTLIKTSCFISTHLQTSVSDPHNHFLLLLKWVVPNENETFSLCLDDHDFNEFNKLHIPVAFNQFLPYLTMVGYCPGLACIRFGLNKFDFITWNPSIRKYIKLPPDRYIIKMTYGFGFDSRTKDYKILVGPKKSIETTTSKTFLFSLNENSWKRVTAGFPEDVVLIQLSATFVNGAFHWIGYQRKQDGGRFVNMILGFDISSEEYFVIKLPESLIGLHTHRLFVVKYEESSIAVLNSDGGDYKQVELWVMNKYGVVGSWTKVLHLTDQSLGFRKNGEVLLQVDGGNMVSPDLNSQQNQIKHLGKEGEYVIVSVDNHVESILVLIDKGVNVGCVSYQLC